MSQVSISGRVIGGQRAAIPSEPSKRQGDLCHTRHPRVIETLRQPRNHPPQQRKEGDSHHRDVTESAIGTLVERTTRYIMLVHLPADHSAEIVRDRPGQRRMGALPAHLRRLSDRGTRAPKWPATRFHPRHRHGRLLLRPASPWQRGSNENTNGLLRQYFPKAQTLSVHSPEHLSKVAAELNPTPRRDPGLA